MDGERDRLGDPWWQRVQAAQGKKFRELADRFGRYGTHKPDDLFQAAMENARRAAPHYKPNPDISFDRYLYKYGHGAMMEMCRNAAIDRHRVWHMEMVASSVQENLDAGNILLEDDKQRKAKHDQGLFAMLAAGAIALLTPASTNPEEQVGSNRLQKRLDAAMATLEPLDQELIVRIVVRGGTVTEVAEQLGIPRTTANRRKDEALEKIGRFFGNRDPR